MGNKSIISRDELKPDDYTAHIDFLEDELERTATIVHNLSIFLQSKHSYNPNRRYRLMHRDLV